MRASLCEARCGQRAAATRRLVPSTTTRLHPRKAHGYRSLWEFGEEKTLRILPHGLPSEHEARSIHPSNPRFSTHERAAPRAWRLGQWRPTRQPSRRDCSRPFECRLLQQRPRRRVHSQTQKIAFRTADHAALYLAYSPATARYPDVNSEAWMMSSHARLHLRHNYRVGVQHIARVVTNRLSYWSFAAEADG